MQGTDDFGRKILTIVPRFPLHMVSYLELFSSGSDRVANAIEDILTYFWIVFHRTVQFQQGKDLPNRGMGLQLLDLFPHLLLEKSQIFLDPCPQNYSKYAVTSALPPSKSCCRSGTKNALLVVVHFGIAPVSSLMKYDLYPLWVALIDMSLPARLIFTEHYLTSLILNREFYNVVVAPLSTIKTYESLSRS